MTLFLIIILIMFVLLYIHPWIDNYTDFRGQRHIVLWFTNHKGERKYTNIIGSQES